MNVRIPTDKKSKILNSGDLYGVMQRVLLRERKIDRNKEHFWVIGLANNNTMLYIELISLGTVNRVPVEPMEVWLNGLSIPSAFLYAQPERNRRWPRTTNCDRCEL